MPVLEGRTRSGPPHLFWEWSGNRAVRRGQWKLVWDKLVRRWELHDLAADRTETRDLASERPDLVKELQQSWFDWAGATGVRIGPAKRKKADRARKSKAKGAKAERAKAKAEGAKATKATKEP